jgi:hypothetical protein
MDCIRVDTQNSFELGIFVNGEEYKIEYKEFRFRFRKLSRNIHNDISRSKWDSLVLFTPDVLKKYAEQYIPKYMVSFANSNIDRGEFYIGITDKGEVLGVPLPNMLNGETSFDNIREIFYDSMRNTIEEYIVMSQYNEINDKKILTDLMIRNTEIKFIPITCTHDLIDDTYDAYIEKYINMKKEYDRAETKYIEEKKIWNQKMFKYKCAINTMINDREIRNEIIAFIEEKDGKQSNEHIISLLKNSIVINFINGQIVEEKNNNTTLAYWIACFRDAMVKNMIKNRPMYHKFNILECPYISVIRDYRPIIKRMMNSGINMMVIKITFPGRNTLIEKFAEISQNELLPMLAYRSGSKFRYSQRSKDYNGDPCCIDPEYI